MNKFPQIYFSSHSNQPFGVLCTIVKIYESRTLYTIQVTWICSVEVLSRSIE